LGLFGFKAVVITGMGQLFGLSVTSLGYYFLFAIMGALNNLVMSLRKKKVETVSNNNIKNW
jgi:hypothetical protein